MTHQILIKAYTKHSNIDKPVDLDDIPTEDEVINTVLKDYGLNRENAHINAQALDRELDTNSIRVNIKHINCQIGTRCMMINVRRMRLELLKHFIDGKTHSKDGRLTKFCKPCQRSLHRTGLKAHKRSKEHLANIETLLTEDPNWKDNESDYERKVDGEKIKETQIFLSSL